MTVEAFFARIELEHQQEVERGEHDEKCEYVRTRGLCHCAKRRREAAGHTTPPGDLEWQHPLCPRCCEEVESDGGNWSCPRCCAQWNLDGENAEFTDEYGDLDDYPGSETTAVIDVELPADVNA